MLTLSLSMTLGTPTRLTGTSALYRPRLMGHRIGAYAAKAAGESCSSMMAAGGWKPCRSISHVAL